MMGFEWQWCRSFWPLVYYNRLEPDEFNLVDHVFCIGPIQTRWKTWSKT